MNADSRLDAALRELFDAAAHARSPAEDEAVLDAARHAAAAASPLTTELRRLEAALGRSFPAAA